MKFKWNLFCSTFTRYYQFVFSILWQILHFSLPLILRNPGSFTSGVFLIGWLFYDENVSIDSECNFDNKFTNWAHCASVLCSCTCSIRSAKSCYDEFSSKSRSEGTCLTGSPRQFWATISSFWFNVNNLQQKHPSGSKVVQKLPTLPIVIFFHKHELEVSTYMTSAEPAFQYKTYSTYCRGCSHCLYRHSLLSSLRHQGSI